MRRSISVASLVIISLFAKITTAEDKKLQGTWLVISAKEAGEATQEPVGDKVTFSDTRMTVQPSDPSEQAPPPLAIKIDAKKPPDPGPLPERCMWRACEKRPAPGIVFCEQHRL